MANKVVPILLQTLKPIKIVKWKVNEGNSVSIGCAFLLYEVDEDDKHVVCKLKSTQAGTVHKLLVQEGDVVKPGEQLFELKACAHPTVMRDMCAECGADLRKDDAVTLASVPMVHSVPELKVSLEQAQEIGKADVDRLLKDRKLVLLVDLDQTLIHTTNDNIPANIRDVYHFQLYGPQSPWYHTRLRPGTHRFLENMSPYFELHICTFGARNYAHMIAMFLDQDGKLFSQRILSRDECFNPTSKTANLKALFPCGDDMVCIIDDREDVWSYAANLIHVKPYHFFQHTGDINAPPGLDKHESDDKEGVDLSTVSCNKKKKIKINGVINKEKTNSNEENNTSDNNRENNENESNEEYSENKEIEENILTEHNNSNKHEAIEENACENNTTELKSLPVSENKETEENIPIEIKINKKTNATNDEAGEENNTTEQKNSTEKENKEIEENISAEIKINKKNNATKNEENDATGDNTTEQKNSTENENEEIEENISAEIKINKDQAMEENSATVNNSPELKNSTVNKDEEMEENITTEMKINKKINTTGGEAIEESNATGKNLNVNENEEIEENISTEMKINKKINATKDEAIEESNATKKNSTVNENEEIEENIPTEIKIKKKNNATKDEATEETNATELKNSTVNRVIEENMVTEQDVEETKIKRTEEIYDTDEEIENMEECESTENNKEETDNVQNKLYSNEKDESKDELIEIEDPDDYLLYLEDILKQIHRTFYEKFDKLEAGNFPDLKKVIPEVRKNVLQGTKLVFSGLVPTHIKLEQSKAYQVARSLGATVTQDLESTTTHLVAVRPGTAKVNAGRRKKNLKIVTPDWLWACAERWIKVDESLYTLSNKGSKNRHPPPHCSSPEHNIDFAPTRKRTPSGRFMDTINPLMSFSSADIADMDREVEDIFNESESEGESKKPKNPDQVILQKLTTEDEESSSSDESLTGEHPHGWRPSEISLKRNREEDLDDESTADEFPSTKFRRGEQLSSDLDIGQDSNSEGSVDAPDEIDDGDWNMMGAALEREFLANN